MIQSINKSCLGTDKPAHATAWTYESYDFVRFNSILLAAARGATDGKLRWNKETASFKTYASRLDPRVFFERQGQYRQIRKRYQAPCPVFEEGLLTFNVHCQKLGIYLLCASSQVQQQNDQRDALWLERLSMALPAGALSEAYQRIRILGTFQSLLGRNFWSYLEVLYKLKL